MKKNLLHYFTKLLVISLLIALYVTLVDPFQVSYCMDNIQETILLVKNEISTIQQGISTCTDQIDSAEFTNEQEAQILEHKRDLINKRRACMEALAVLRDTENEYLNAKVEVSSLKK